MEKTADEIVNEMITSNMLDFGMDSETVKNVILDMERQELSNGFEVEYDVDDLVSAYERINA